MLGRKTVLGICVLCALAFSAIAASTASAEQKANQCVPGGEGFKDAHCKEAASPGTFGQVVLPNEPELIEGTNGATRDEGEGKTNAGTTSKLLGALSGVITEVQCTSLSGEGQLTNEASSVTGEGVINYSGCSVTKPAEKGCAVTGGTVSTNNLEGTTVGQAAGKLKFTPATGETSFAIVPIEGCSIKALNNNFPVTGSLVADVSGATTTTTHAGVTTQNTLKFGGVKAGIEGALTISTSPTEEGEEEGKIAAPVTLK